VVAATAVTTTASVAPASHRLESRRRRCLTCLPG
jgi:hypothetical protein